MERFEQINGQLYEAGWKAQFISGIIMPLMGFISNIGYVVGQRRRAACSSPGRRSPIGDVQAFIQYARQFTQPIIQAGECRQHHPVGDRLGGAGV